MMRSKFGGKGDEEEDEEEIEKKEQEDSERRTKHSIEGILGDRCESLSSSCCCETFGPFLFRSVEIFRSFVFSSARHGAAGCGWRVLVIFYRLYVSNAFPMRPSRKSSSR